MRVCALYPEIMSIYADRGNLLMLARRCAWRGIDFELVTVTLGERLDSERFDLYYLGGGQDADQRLCARDLYANKRDSLHEAAARGAIVLGVCGGYQLLGHSYELGSETIPGVGLLDVQTTRGDGERLIGNIAIELDDGRRLAGFENHGGRTLVGTAHGQRPLGRVLRGHGNDGHSGFEGAQLGSVIGTYLHGPLLPKNAWFCDLLIQRSCGGHALQALDDSFEDAAHAAALAAAGV